MRLVGTTTASINRMTFLKKYCQQLFLLENSRKTPVFNEFQSITINYFLQTNQNFPLFPQKNRDFHKLKKDFHKPVSVAHSSKKVFQKLKIALQKQKNVCHNPFSNFLKPNYFPDKLNFNQKKPKSPSNKLNRHRQTAFKRD